MRGDVSVLGLGDMGRALAGAFLDAGRRTVVWNRTASRVDALVERGAERAADAGEAVRDARLVVVCLLDPAAVREVLEPLARELRGRTVVDLTNGSPAQAAELAGWAAGAGITCLDGGIMAVPGTIASPGAFVLYSGPQEAFARWRTDLEVLGTAHWLGEDTGLASLHDIALLSAMDLMFHGFNLAVAMATSRPGGSAAGVTELLVPWLGSMGALMPAFAAEIDAEAADGTPPRLTQGLDVQTAGMLNMVATARDAGVDTEWLDLSPARLRALSAGGHDTWSAPLGVRQLRAAVRES
ncbi:NAD(P)-binding domain-containing protein [Streptomyces uncialis]|uniref:NAD(P)-dependent oxidoreductase n=1 Tax=Streptomyces uncialis TaxID=1048205 RepID=UPI002E361E4F|nr:NAD(P)-binding domain-containing protein [Streptomyces uncialis]